MSEMDLLFNKFQEDASVRAAVLISGKPGCFIAGADIKMIERCKSKDEAVALSKGGQDFFFKVLLIIERTSFSFHFKRIFDLV